MVKSNRKIYLDYASSVDPNPSSIHDAGVIARGKLELARKSVADVLLARPSQIVFTSGGTESNNLVILGVLENFCVNNTFKNKKYIPHIIVTNIEHPSVLETCKYLEAQNRIELSIIPVERNGIVDPKKIKKEIKSGTILVSVMYANNEIGTIQPIREIAKEIRHFKKNNNSKVFPLFHTDAVQASNYLDLAVERLGVDLLTLSGSKIEGSGKVGVLYAKNTNNLAPVFHGGDQEMKIRPGTENVTEIIKFAKALQTTQHLKQTESKRLVKIQRKFAGNLSKLVFKTSGKEVVINGDLENRLPNNLNVTIPSIPSDLLVIELSAQGIYVSSKSACKSGDGKMSHVIKAINPEIKETDGSLRFSFGRKTKWEDLEKVLEILKPILVKLKKWYN